MPKTPRFTVLHEKFRGKTFDLEKDVISIGRKDTMDICIKDPSVSGHHADLIKSERDGRIVYTLRREPSDVPALAALMPGLSLAWNGGESTLTAEFDASVAPDALNELLLPKLIPCGVVSVVSGRTLEQAYLRR